MARKGILVNDPLVAKLTRAQWLYEYYNLLRIDSDQTKLYVEIAQSILMNLLGLNVFGKNENGKDKVVPLSLICGNPNLLKSLFNKAEEDGIAEAASVPDAEYEAMSERIMADMEPFDDPTAGMTPAQLLARHQEKLLDVQVLDDTAKVSIDSIEDA